MKWISFIIPVYNVEKYVEKCVESILNQIEADVELILVDDGSTDSSGEICDFLEKNNNIVKVVHKKNGGLASARNEGLKYAEGEYIAFIDSDDYIADDSLKGLVGLVKKTDVDVCFLKVRKVYEDGTSYDLGECIEKKYVNGKEKNDILKYLSTRPKFPGSAWGKIYRRQFLVDNKLHFPYESRRSEDLSFSYDAIRLAEKYDVYDKDFYMYRQGRMGSITASKLTQQTFKDLNMFIEESILKSTVNQTEKSKGDKYLMSFVAYEYANLMYGYSNMELEDKNAVYELLNKNKWVLKFSNTLRIRGIYILLRILGLKITCAIVSMVKNR